MIDYLRRFSVHDLKRLGMLRDRYNGSMQWTQNGEKVASIGLRVRLTGDEPAVLVQYTLTETEEAVSDWIKLHFQPSNLPNMTGGYWMFICPATDTVCRVLYLYKGHFVGLAALPKEMLYKSQTHPKSLRLLGRAWDCEEAMEAIRANVFRKYRKASYRGSATRIVKQLMNKEEMYQRVLFRWLSLQNGGGFE